MTIEIQTFRATEGAIQTYAAGTLKALALDDTVIDNDDEAIDDVSDVASAEITGGTYARLTLTGVSWDFTGEWPGLRVDDLEFEGIADDTTVGSVVLYHDLTGDLVAIVRFDPVSVTGDLLIEWPDGYVVTRKSGTSGGSTSGALVWRGAWTDSTAYATGDTVHGADGGLYTATASSLNLAPESNPAQWDLLVQTQAGDWTTFVTGTPTDLPGWVSLVDYGGPAGPRVRRLADGRVEFGGLAMYVDGAGTPAEPPPGTVLCTLTGDQTPGEQPFISSAGVDVFGGGAPLGFASLSLVGDEDELDVVVNGLPAGSTAIAITPTTWDHA